MLSGCFAASDTGGTEVDYQGILDNLVQSVLHSVKKLGFRQRSWVFQRDNDIKQHKTMVEKEKMDCF